MHKRYLYLVNKNTELYIRRIVINNKHHIIMEDKETDGHKISYYIEGNYSKTNIERHLLNMFRHFELIKQY